MLTSGQVDVHYRTSQIDFRSSQIDFRSSQIDLPGSQVDLPGSHVDCRQVLDVLRGGHSCCSRIGTRLCEKGPDSRDFVARSAFNCPPSNTLVPLSRTLRPEPPAFSTTCPRHRACENGAACAVIPHASCSSFSRSLSDSAQRRASSVRFAGC